VVLDLLRVGREDPAPADRRVMLGFVLIALGLLWLTVALLCVGEMT
jgi:hypothetical protein